MRQRGAAIRVAVGTLALVCTVGPASAAALETGVHVDPGSPAAKEYALPLEQARQTDATPKSSGQAPLFGAGIKPPGGSSPTISSSTSSPTSGSSRSPRSSRAGGSSRGGGNRGAGGSSRAGLEGAGRTAAIRRREENAAYVGPPFTSADLRTSSSGGGDGSLLALIGGGIAVLILGGFGGTVLRHSRRPSTP
jgi:hypothetical protein